MSLQILLDTLYTKEQLKYIYHRNTIESNYSYIIGEISTTKKFKQIYINFKKAGIEYILFDLAKELLDSRIHKSKTNPSLNFSVHNQDDYINAFSNLLSINEPFIENLKKSIDPIKLQQIFSGQYSGLNPNNYKAYENFLSLKIIEPIDFVKNVLPSFLHAEDTKKNLSFYIHNFIKQPSLELGEFILKKYEAIKLVDPLFVGLPNDKLLLSMEDISFSELKEKFTFLINGSESLIEELQTFSIVLNLDNLSNVLRNNEGAKYAIFSMHKYLDKSKIEGNQFLQGYQSPILDVEAVIKKMTGNQNNSSLSPLLRKFEFEYKNEDEKNLKHKVMKDFFNTSLTKNITSPKELDIILNSLILKHTLDLDLKANTSSKPKNKI